MAQAENRGLLAVDPAELLRDNPAAFIVNRESYELIGAHFSPQRFDHPQVTRVATFSATGEEAVRLFIVDGNTRTKFVNDHRQEIQKAHPDFAFQPRDVTESLIRNPKIVYPEERTQGQNKLTMLQYLRAVVPPTVEHSQIAPDRIAAHLINGWDNMVGAELSEKFSAIAALSFLQSPRVPIATDALLRQELSRQREIMSGETREERTRLDKALMEMASIIRQTKLLKEHVAESAFILVASGSPTIGGERTTYKQIYGLLHTPVVEARLADLNISQREQARAQLGQLLGEAFSRFAATPNRDQIINGVLIQALRDPKLNLDQARQVLSAERPGEIYDQIRQDINSGKLKEAYLRSTRKTEISELEAALVDNLGRKTHLDEREFATLVRSIDQAADTIAQAQRARTQLSQQREELLGSGVKPQTFADALIDIDKAQGALTSANSAQTVSMRARELRVALETVNNKITREVGMQRTGQLVDEVYGDRLQNGHGAIVRGRIIAFIASEFNKIDSSNEALVRQRINQLSGLSEELQTEVITGVRRLQSALAIQNQRLQTPAEQPRVTPRRQFVEPPVQGLTGARPLETPPPAVPIVPEVDQDQVVLDRQAREERRKALNLQRLTDAMTSFTRILNTLDLEGTELSEPAKQQMDQLLKMVGKLRFDHPDIVRVLERDYPRLQEEIRRSRSLQVQQEAADTYNSTRTQI